MAYPYPEREYSNSEPEYAGNDSPAKADPIMQAEKSLAVLNQAIDVLEKRLSLVLTPVRPEEEARKAIGEDTKFASSPLAAKIEDMSSGMRKASYRINSIAERVELL